VTTAHESGLLGASDEDHLRFASREQRVLITQDADFLAMHQAGAVHAGIAYYEPGQRPLGDLLKHLCLIHDCMTEAEMQGRVEYM